MRALGMASLVLLAAMAGCVGSTDEALNSTNTSSAEDTNQTNATTNDTTTNTTQDETSEEDDEPAEDNQTREQDGNRTRQQETNETDEPEGPPPGTVIAEGHIAVGSPTTRFLLSATVATGQEGIESFGFELPANVTNGTVLATNTTDNSGLGYDLDIYFHDANGSFLGGCSTNAPGEEACEVPEDAAQGTVDAFRGADLDVKLLVASLPDDG